MESKQKVIIYCRVSSKKQVKEGNGLDSQEQQCRAWARNRGYNVEKVFIEPGISGSTDNRPAFNEMQIFLMRNRNKYIVLAYDLNRFARNSTLYGIFRNDMKKYGHCVQTVTMQLEETAESELMETVSAAVAQYEQQKNKARTQTNMKAHAQQGYWILNAPVGYIMKRRNGRVCWVRLEPTATFLQEALEGFATGRFATQTAVKEYLEQAIIIGFHGRPIPITLNFVKNMLMNEKYTGWFAYNKWNIPYQKWHIEPIISTETFKLNQDRLYGRNTNKRIRKYNVLDEDFPLRRWVLCPECGTTMTADRPRSKSGKRHMYYHCKNKNCIKRGKNIKQSTMHADMEQLLQTITPNQSLLNLTRSMLIDAYNERRTDTNERQSKLNDKITELQKEKEQAFALLMKNINSPEIEQMCKHHIQDVTNKIECTLAELETCGTEEMPLDYALDKVCEFVTHPLEIWRAGNYQQKQGVLNLCFSEKISYDEIEKFRTPKLSPIFAIFNDNLGNNNLWRTQKDSNPQSSDP